MKEETRIIRSGGEPQPLARTVNPPIQRASTVLLPDAASLYSAEVSYGRDGLAPRTHLADAISELEGAAGTCLYPSGLAALTGALLALLKAGDEVLVCSHVYRPTRRFCDRVLKRYGVAVRYYPQTLPPEELGAMIGEATRVIVLESPGSLTFEMQDVRAIAAIARARGVLTVMDNTWAAGLLFKPLRHGVDVSCQALTKYMGGHSDVFMGSAAARDAEVLKQLEGGVLEMGWSVAPEDAYLMIRGLRTLATRLERHGRSGVAVAEWLRGQPEVLEVLHPALSGARGHELWKRDFTGACGLFGFVLKPPAPEAAVHAFLDALQLFGLGFSWGGHESLAINCDPQRQARPGEDYGGPLIRLHVGLEAPEDLIADLRQALDVFGEVAGR